MRLHHETRKMVHRRRLVAGQVRERHIATAAWNMTRLRVLPARGAQSGSTCSSGVRVAQCACSACCRSEYGASASPCSCNLPPAMRAGDTCSGDTCSTRMRRPKCYPRLRASDADWSARFETLGSSHSGLRRQQLGGEGHSLRHSMDLELLDLLRYRPLWSQKGSGAQ